MKSGMMKKVIAKRLGKSSGYSEPEVINNKKTALIAKALRSLKK